MDPAVLDLLRTWPTPTALRHAGRRRIANRLIKLVPRVGERLADDIIEPLVEAHPLHPVLTSMPAVGVRTAARILTHLPPQRMNPPPRE